MPSYKEPNYLHCLHFIYLFTLLALLILFIFLALLTLFALFTLLTLVTRFFCKQLSCLGVRPRFLEKVKQHAKQLEASKLHKQLFFWHFVTVLEKKISNFLPRNEQKLAKIAQNRQKWAKVAYFKQLSSWFWHKK